MIISAAVREQVRQRANFVCEFCGISETDAGGELTIDHFQPKRHGGGDDIDNLLYCCIRCNQHKLDYWPASSDSPFLWNPRQSPLSQHFVELDDGTLHPITETGAFTLHRLRLNRSQLVTHRRRNRQKAENARLLVQYRDVTRLITQMFIQQSTLMDEQGRLFAWLRIIFWLLRGSEK